VARSNASTRADAGEPVGDPPREALEEGDDAAIATRRGSVGAAICSRLVGTARVSRTTLDSLRGLAGTRASPGTAVRRCDRARRPQRDGAREYRTL